MKQALITNIQRFSLNDGPGIRTTVFFQGCNMHCLWCHNPETIPKEPVLMHYQNRCIGCGRCFAIADPLGSVRIENGKHVIDRKILKNPQELASNCQADALVLSSRSYTVEEVMAEIRQDKLYYDLSGGGVTVSGGESTLHGDFVSALADSCHEEGMRIAIETNMAIAFQALEPVLQRMDLIMCDIKILDPQKHKKYTGVDNQLILNNVERASHLGIPMIVRTPLIPGASDDLENLRGIAKFVSGLENIVCYELLNFNPLGSSKRDAMDTDDRFSECRPFSKKDLEAIEQGLAESGVELRIS
ncbi:MAG: glycyl-radical enzyme activating protein [Spirochaetales bacterium]|nr:glycyl-radical enzyme activating protein [Spirochaetales bacterium]